MKNLIFSKKLSSRILYCLIGNYAKEGEQLVDRRYKKNFLRMLAKVISQSYITQNESFSRSKQNESFSRSMVESFSRSKQ